MPWLLASKLFNQYHDCWRPGSLRRQGISSHDINLIGFGLSQLCRVRVNLKLFLYWQVIFWLRCCFCEQVFAFWRLQVSCLYNYYHELCTRSGFVLSYFVLVVSMIYGGFMWLIHQYRDRFVYALSQWEMTLHCNWHYIVTSSLIGWAHTQNSPCLYSMRICHWYWSHHIIVSMVVK